IYINHGPGVTSFGNDYGTFRVVGAVFWAGGTYHPRVPAEQHQWAADLWYATGNFDISGTAALAPVPLSDENDPWPLTTDNKWKAIGAGGQITAANNTPSINANTWAIQLPGNPVKELWV